MDLDLQRPAALLPAVIAIARAAGREIMGIYRQGFTVKFKDDRSPLTEADLAAQQVIAAALARLTPDVPMLGEESAPEEIAARHSWPALWLVDPLDGTREFVRRNGEFTVNIALVHQHQPVLGVLHAPASGALYAAARGHGAWQVDEQEQATRLQAAPHAPAVPRVLGSRSHRGKSLDGLLARLGAHELCVVGSALKFAWLAAGRADLYARLSPTCEWDTAAGHVIAEEAGAQVRDLAGQPLRYNARTTLVNPPFLCWADPDRDWLALASEA
jgi:3'(2'), 5'-bisphosphate nucleotidase